MVESRYISLASVLVAYPFLLWKWSYDGPMLAHYIGVLLLVISLIYLMKTIVKGL